MKKFLLSILCCLMAVFAVQAQTTKTHTYDFSQSSVWVTTAGGTTNVAIGSNNKLSAFYHKDSGDKFNAGSKGYFNESGYFLWGKSGAYIELPTFPGEKITNITATSSNYGSTSVKVGVYSASKAVCTAVTWSTKNTDFSYDIPEAYQSSVLRLQIASSHNAQITKLVVTTITNGETPIIPTAKEPTFSQESCDFNLGEHFAVTLSAEEDGATIYYTTDGNDPTEESRVYLSTIVISETTTVKAIAVVDGYNNSAVAEATYTAIDPNAPTATLSFASTDQRKSFSAEQQVWKQNGITFTNDKGSGSNLADYSNPVRLYKNSDITIETTREMSKIEFDCNTEEYATDLATSIGGVEAVGDKVTVTLSPAAKSYTISLTEGQVRLDAITVTYATQPQPLGFTVALTVGEVGYATLYLGAAAQIPEGVSAYIVTDTSNGYAKMKEVTGIIPANTGVILVAEQGEYEFAFYDKGTADVTGNLLAGTLSHEYIDEEAYVLSAPDGVVGLYKAAMNQLDGTAWQNNANKAYLPASAVHNKAAAFYGFEWNGTTGIEGVEAEVAQDGAIYDLSGRRVKAITVPGIYIVNGKKVVVK